MSEFKLKKARVAHECSSCGNKINISDEYFCEERFLSGLHKPLEKYCIKCFKK